VEFEKPSSRSGLYPFTLAEYQKARGDAWGVVFQGVCRGKRNGELQEYAYNREQATRHCGCDWKVNKCNVCGTVQEAGATPLYACNSWACPTCAPVKARALRRALVHYGDTHPVKRIHGKVSRGYFLWTLTVPSYGISVRSFRAQRAELKRLVDTLWQKVLRFTWRREPGGEAWETVGKVEEAGALVVFEVGPHGNLHAHVLVYGAWCPVTVARELVIAKAGEYRHLDVKGVSSKENRIHPKAVAELGKYLTKVSSGPEGWNTHPMIAVLFELASVFPKAQRVLTKGTMIGFKKALKEADQEDDFEEEPCALCGGLDFDRVVLHRPYPFLPWETGPPGEEGPRESPLPEYPALPATEEQVALTMMAIQSRVRASFEGGSARGVVVPPLVR
jgi:hypothetical protein